MREQAMSEHAMSEPGRRRAMATGLSNGMACGYRPPGNVIRLFTERFK
jgi:hypothetical protein